MYDTVKISICQELDSRLLERFATLEMRISPLHPPIRRWFYNSEDGLFRFTYYEGERRILLEVSLPRLVFGHNLCLLINPSKAFERWDEEIHRRLPFLPSCRMWMASRIDFCWEFFVGDDVERYIQAGMRLSIPRHRTVTWFGQSVEWFAKSHSFAFYDKAQQIWDTYGDGALARRAEGILRIESRIEGAGRIRRALKLGKGATLQDVLSVENARGILVRDLRRSKMDLRISSFENLMDALTEIFGVSQGIRLYGFVIFVFVNRGREGAIQKGLSPRSFRHYSKMLRDAGIAPSVIDLKTGKLTFQPKDLSPLEIPSCEEIEELAGEKGYIEPEELPRPLGM
jgi:hypothetical protein